MRPNILIFMTDQQRGVTVLPDHPLKAITPNFDRFAQEATVFTRAYCPSPHCCPSRATFFTGQYPSRHGVWNNVTGANSLARGPRKGVSFWSERLAEAGYEMQFSGKWHVSNRQPPSDFGWNVLYSSSPVQGRALDSDAMETETWRRAFQRLQDGIGCSDSQLERRPGEILRPGYQEYVHYAANEDPFDDRVVTEHAIDYLRSRRKSENPWCLFVGTLGPHDPYIPPQRFLDLYPELPELPRTFYDSMLDKPALYRRTRDVFDQLSEEEHREALRHYLAFCSYEDYLFGEVLAALKASGELDRTAVLFLSDHGDYMGEHGLWCKGLPCFDSGYHIPAAVRLPGVKTARTVSELVSLADFAPSLLDLAEVPYDPLSYPGASIMPFVRGTPPRSWRDALFFQTNGNEIYGVQRAIRTERWKLVYNSFDYDELYDLEEDPDELHNLLARPVNGKSNGNGSSRKSHELKPVVRELYRQLWKFNLNNGDGMLSEYVFTALGQFGPRIAFEKV